MDKDLHQWFAREILIHEDDLTAFLKSWTRSTGDDVRDIRNDVYIKVLEAAQRKRPPVPRAFLFTTAKHHLIDLARHRRIIPIELAQDLPNMNPPADDRTPERILEARESLQRAVRALLKLSDRCREAFWLRRVHGLSQKEIAAQLGIRVSTVESHLARAVREYADQFHSAETSEANAQPQIEQVMDDAPDHAENDR